MAAEKITPIILVILLVLFMIAGCSSGEVTNSSLVDKTAAIHPDATQFEIQIDVDGLYTIDRGLFDPPGIDKNDLSVPDYFLSAGDKPVPFSLTESAILFYGQGPDGRYSTSRTYHLQLGKPGVLMDELLLPASDDLISSPTIRKTAHFEENLHYDGSASGALNSGDQEFEPWFWQTIQVGSAVEVDLELTEEPIGPTELKLGLWGVTENNLVEDDHDLMVFVNGEFVSQIIWDGQSYYSSTISLAANELQQGNNQIVLDNKADGAVPVDISRLDWVEISYEAEPTAIDDQLLIPDAYGLIEVGGFSSPPIILDISAEDEPIILTGWDFESNSVSLGVPDFRDILLVGSGGLREPAHLYPASGTELRSNLDQADMIVITTDVLAPALQPLIAARQAQSLEVRLVTLDEIYESYGQGQNGPDTITEFVRFAYNNWDEPRPKYLFLVGEGSYDYRSYLGEGPSNIIPPPMVPVRYSGETVSDSLLGDIDGDHRPDLAVGRWPVDSPQEVASLVTRTLAYENGEITDTALFIADGSSDEFSKFNADIIDKSRFQSGTVDQFAGDSSDALLQTWNRGAWLVSYAGHGSLDRWGKQGVLTEEAVEGLTSAGVPPIVLQLTCLTGYFAHPSAESLSETLLLHQNGPVLVVAASSLTLSQDQQPFAINMLSQLMDPAILRIGDAFVQAKADLNVSEPGIREISDTFGLFGDPATLIARPK